MTLKIEPYKPIHLEKLLLQPSQEYMRPYMENKEYQKALDVKGMAYSAIRDGEVLACGGIAPLWEGRGHSWALISDDLKHDFIWIHRATMRFFDTCDMRRIETHVDPDFGCAVRWIKMLGFDFEGVEKKYTPDGRDVLRYARIK